MSTVGFDVSALDPKFKSHAFRGIGRYVQELKAYFDRNVSEDMRVGYFDHRDFREKGMINSLIEFLPAGRQTMRQQLVYPLHLGKFKKQFDILHFPAHMDAPAWSVNNYVLTVLDLIPLVMGELYKASKPGWRFQFARWLENSAIKNASLLLAISQNTADDLVRVLGIDPARIVVTPLGIDPAFYRRVFEEEKVEVRSKYNIPEGRDIVIYVGGIDPRKNTNALIRSFSFLTEMYREKNMKDPLLVMVGNIAGDREYAGLQERIRSLSLKDSVVETGYAPDADLQALYSLSNVMFFPSLYEGFGLTPLEAMAAGLPVVCSKTSCMPEVLGRAAYFVDPENHKMCANMLFEVINEVDLDDARAKGTERATHFTWERTGRLTMEAYEGLLAGRYAKADSQN